MEDNQPQDKSINKEIISAAKTGQIKMRPKWHFILNAALWAVGIAAVTLALLYLASLFVFINHSTGIWIAPIFGLRGLFIFLASLPWMIVALVVIFAVILEILVRHYSFAYRLPLLYSGLAILFVIAAGGLLLARTPLHNMLSHCPPVGGPPPCAMGFYRDLGPRRFNNIHTGVIDSLLDPDFTIINRQQERLFILVTKRTRLPFGEDFSVGDTVVVIGDRSGNQVEAFGISEIK